MGVDIGRKVRTRSMSVIKELQMVFQNPDSTMNPNYSIGKQIERPLRRFGTVPQNDLREEVVRLLRAVKLDEHYYDRLPRQLSGGEKQRVGIARALAGRPDLVLCDEPVSALDVSVQAAVINLLLEVQEEFDTTMIFIAHDLSIVRFFSDYVAVMYLGKVVELGPTEAVFETPRHPYTQSLLSAIPQIGKQRITETFWLEGEPPDPGNLPSGCRFRTRCPRAVDRCAAEIPPLAEKVPGHEDACLLSE